LRDPYKQNSGVWWHVPIMQPMQET
jgi:hypothetical protein